MHPRLWKKNIEAMKGPLQRLGQSYDWDHELCTCDPSYFVHEQRIFIEMWRRGMAYRKGALVNWCPACATVLANEQVEDGLCWRCQSVVVQRELTQWFIRITAYAQEILDDISAWKASGQTRCWPCRPTGLVARKGRIKFALSQPLPADDSGPATGDIEVFTTRPDTLFGATYMSIAAEHPLACACRAAPRTRPPSLPLCRKCAPKTRSAAARRLRQRGRVHRRPRHKSRHRHPHPCHIANFVLMDYGTGAVMAVPAHDQRDFEFGRKVRPAASGGDRAAGSPAGCRDDGSRVRRAGHAHQLRPLRRHGKRRRQSAHHRLAG